MSSVTVPLWIPGKYGGCEVPGRAFICRLVGDIKKWRGCVGHEKRARRKGWAGHEERAWRTLDLYQEVEFPGMEGGGRDVSCKLATVRLYLLFFEINRITSFLLPLSSLLNFPHTAPFSLPNSWPLFQLFDILMLSFPNLISLFQYFSFLNSSCSDFLIHILFLFSQ